jgi:hypothetical protein
MKDNMSVWGKLSSDLIAASKEHVNCRLTSNGGQHGKMFLHCSNFKFYPESSRIKKSQGEYRKHTINQNKNNARQGQDSKKLNKKTSTSKPLKANNDTTCKVRLMIGIDLYSFFLFCGLGKDMHEGHPPLDTNHLPTRLRSVPNEATETAKLMATKGARPGLISGMLHDMYGIELSKRQVAQTTQMAKLAKDLIGANDLERIKGDMSDLDRLTVYLKSIGASVVALYHRKGDCDAEMGKKRKADYQAKSSGGCEESAMNDVLIMDCMNSTGEVKGTKVEYSGINGINEDLMKYASDTQKVVGASNDQDVLVALVWVTPEGKQFFQAFPEQASIDGTHKTNAEGWELITVSVQDMNGNQEVVIRCWAPNNRAWLFRWLFQSAIPLLVGKKACN